GRGARLGDGAERRGGAPASAHPPEPRLFRRGDMADSGIVTGAGTGIGYALARSFAQTGARVGLNDLDGALAERAARGLNDEIGAERVIAFGLDVSDVAAVRRMVAEADERFGGLNVVVANAGITNYG